MTDWRYWVTWESTVTAATEEDAIKAAMGHLGAYLHDPAASPFTLHPTIEVEEIEND